MARFLTIIAAIFIWSGSASAQTKVGLVLPLEGSVAVPAKRMEFGAMLAAGTLRDEMRVKLVSGGCDDEEIDNKIATLKKADVDIVVGPPCFSGALAIARGLNQDGGKSVPVIALSTRSSGMERARSYDGLPIFEISPPARSEAATVVQNILPRFNGEPFAIVDDGSVYGRGLADAVRLAADEAGLRAVANENFRPLQRSQVGLVRRLAAAGAKAVFIAAEPEDVLTITRDIFQYQPTWQVAGGEAARLVPFLEGANRLRDGLLAIRLSELKLLPDAQLGNGVDMERLDVEDSLILGYIAIQIASTQANKESGLLGNSFDTVIGPIRFSADGRASVQAFEPIVMRGGEWQPLP
ncbi:ABC transporter substrate-binding protein [Ahrensia sp. R2A130]|uniref:ABC transporter substrate-binding protein n=1 Tax=Ahrensia sp. R2A130 TaxID=744979 RepID=UPI0001E0B470|nr:ABC transporter substrate-binding protein [Ahrensia sp. R2A130]EFL90157.1 putative ABC transporter, substrate binding protein [amino acid] [Ahrensia sp. R2A130]